MSNPLMLQSFEWHTPSTSDSSHYKRLIRLLPTLAQLGISHLWLPPGCKANNPKGNGYDIYDLWDLGEYNQKGQKSTKWGSRKELDSLIYKAWELKIKIVWDAVLSHKTGADGTEEVWVVEVDKDDRRYEICSPKKIEAWLRFDFSDRRQKREPSKKGLRGTSDMQWRAEHFNGTDYDNRDSKHAIFKLIDDPSTLAEPFIQPKRRKSSNPFLAGRKMGSLLRRFNSDFLNQGAPEADPPRRPGKGWAEDVDKEHGNNDFLMFSNIDYSHSAVREDVVSWGWWMVDEVHVDGFRLDAVQHISFDFIKLWIQSVKDVVRNRNDTSTSLFLVGEVWSGDVGRITKWIDAVDSGGDPRIHAFDAPLLYNFSRISEDFKNKPKNVDLRTILRNSLLEQRPNAAITLVTNHDTQPGQICYTPMERDLKLLWYAFILLRKEGMPCVFWGDLFGTRGHNIEEPPIEVKKDDEGHFKKSYSKKLVKLMLCRKYFAHGEQTDFWDSPLTIAWRRAGDKNRQGSGCFVVLNLASKHHSHKLKPKVPIGRPEEVWVDALEHIDKKVEIDDEGCGKLPTKGPGVSVWIPKGSEHLLELSDELKEGMNIYHE